MMPRRFECVLGMLRQTADSGLADIAGPGLCNSQGPRERCNSADWPAAPSQSREVLSWVAPWFRNDRAGFSCEINV